jgi:hypothetical protein
MVEVENMAWQSTPLLTNIQLRKYILALTLLVGFGLDEASHG